MHLNVFLASVMMFITLGCSDDSSMPTSTGDLDRVESGFDGQVRPTEDMRSVDMARVFPDAMPPQITVVDAAIDTVDQGAGPSIDAMIDAAVQIDAEVVMPPDCDPREMAVACDEGFYCKPRASAIHQGDCMAGDGCNITAQTGCDDPNKPYCHLMGKATVCRAAGTGVAGDDCRDEMMGPQACAPGFVCGGSICRAVCDPISQSVCENGERCADISDGLSQTLGLCVEKGCNFYSGDGCRSNETCRFVITTSGEPMGRCSLRPIVESDGMDCVYGVEDDCADGLVCLRATRGNVCRTLCDSGAYEMKCGSSRACREAIELGNMGDVVRGVGICIINR